MARRPEQIPLLEESPPLRPGNILYCHQEFLEKMEENRANTVGRRASLLLQRLWVDLRRQYYKPTQGDNRGWRRSPLGGNHGNHFYAWWAPKGAAPLKGDSEFESAPEGAIFLRDIRHHDDHRPLNPQSLAEHYLPVGVKDLRQEEYVPPPWTQAQSKFAEARQKIRIIKGFPGSGKTTALWHAADLAGRKAVLYITYSPQQLAALARDHFDKFASGNKRFHVVTYSDFLKQVTGTSALIEPVRIARPAFVKEISGFSPTILGPWSGEKAALYDEAHAHLIGAALPSAIGRFPGFPDRRISARQYRDLRERAIGRVAAEAVVEVCETLRRRDPRPIEGRFFQELDLAWNAVQRIRSQGAGRFAEFDCIALDEAQDLTPIESLAIVELAASVSTGTALNLLVSGDESQTVRPTDFEWGWFQDLIHFRLASPVEFKLQTNLRSPRRIATLVNLVWNFYDTIAKSERPGAGVAEIDENAGDQVILCSAKSGPELDELLEVLSEREGMALIAMGEEIPRYVPERLRDRVLTTFEAKGLDFQSVCILDAGKWLDRILLARERGRGLELEDLSKRLAIDQLRVAISRPAERLYWLDVNPSERTVDHAINMLAHAGERAYPMVPAGILKTLEEEALDAEERVRLCESDAHQFLPIRPTLAWSRARQAVALLGDQGGKFSVSDPAARESAHLTLCQVAVTLALRKVNLPSEMGRVDLFEEAAYAADRAGRNSLGALIRAIGRKDRTGAGDSPPIFLLASMLAEEHQTLEPWLLTELQPRSAAWLEELEVCSTLFPEVVLGTMPVLYKLFVPLEADRRIAAARDKSVRVLMQMKGYKGALQILLQTPGADPKLIAECREGLGELDLAAAEYLKAGATSDALRCYRLIPDFDKTLELLDAVGKHPARESLLWLRQIRDLAAQRPAEFQKVILPNEKQVLEDVLQTALGVTRKKPAAKKKAAVKKKAPTPRKKREEFF